MDTFLLLLLLQWFASASLRMAATLTADKASWTRTISCFICDERGYESVVRVEGVCKDKQFVCV